MQIVPAILEKNFREVKQKIKFIDGKFDPIQIDICDGKFVKTKTWQNPDLLRKLKTESSFEIHLMVKSPEKEIKKWLFRKIKRVVFHYEAIENKKDLQWLNPFSEKVQLGLAINPETRTEVLKGLPLSKFEEILFLGVDPGKQGQKFQEKVLRKIKSFQKTKWKPKRIKIAVDGGLNDKILLKLDKLRVDFAVVGSYFWKNI